MIGDITFALSVFPIHIVSSWWEKSIFNHGAALELETKSSQVERNNVPAVANNMYPRVPGLAPPNTLHFPRKVSSDSRRPGHSRSSSPESSQDAIQLDPRVQKGSVQRVPSNGTPNGHQIWHPPPSSYSNADEDSPGGSIPNARHSRPDSDDDLDLQQREQVEEWRQYPPFPSAYPPTPLVTASSRLPNDPPRPLQPPSNTGLTDISEDDPQEDFRGSLLPPRKPLNPSYVGLSDDSLTHPGVQNMDIVDDEMAIHIDSETTDMDDEEEDEFNTTLRTPLPLLGSARSHLRDTAAKRPVSFASSVASKSTALTTAGGSSLRTQSSSESLLSAAMSMVSSTESSSVVGKKRPLPRNRVVSVRNKARLIDRTTVRSTPRRRGIPNSPLPRPPQIRKVPRREQAPSASETVSEDTSSADNIDEQKTHTAKRRKIALPPGRVVPPSRLVRHRITRYATPPRRAVQAKLTTAPVASAPSRSSARLRSGVVQFPATVRHTDVTQSSFSSSNDVRRAKRGGQNATKAN